MRVEIPAAILTAAAAVLAHAGRFSEAADVLTHFAPLYVLTGAGVTLAALLLRPARRPPLILGLTAVLAGGALMAPEYLRAPEPRVAPAAGQIKLIQFNALKRNADIVKVADWLIAQDPDIITLQEARHDLRDELLRRTRWRLAGRREHVMIFSREPRLRMVRPAGVGAPLTYVNATYPSPDGAYEVVTTHFDWPIYATHRRQHQALAQIVGRLPRDRMIATGDFNATPWSFALRRTDRSLGLRRIERAMWSFPARVGRLTWPAPALPIDHIYVGPGWRVVSLERGPGLGSDHYPLVVTLAPASPQPAPSPAALAP